MKTYDENILKQWNKNIFQLFMYRYIVSHRDQGNRLYPIYPTDFFGITSSMVMFRMIRSWYSTNPWNQTCVFGAFFDQKEIKETHTHTHITTSHPKRITNPTHKRLFIYTSFLCIVHALSTANIAIHLVAPGRSTRVEVLQCQKARSVEESANGRQERQKVLFSFGCMAGRKNCKV